MDIGITEGNSIKTIDMSADGWAIACSGSKVGELAYIYWNKKRFIFKINSFLIFKKINIFLISLLHF